MNIFAHFTAHETHGTISDSTNDNGSREGCRQYKMGFTIVSVEFFQQNTEYKGASLKCFQNVFEILNIG